MLVHPLLVHRLPRPRPRRRRSSPGASAASRDTLFLLAWIGIFFAGAVVVFFAGSARYLLPMAAPVACSPRACPSSWLAPAFALQLALGLGLAAVNYQHWDGYRTSPPDFAPPPPDTASGWMASGACATTWKADHALPAHQRPAGATGRHRRQQRTRPQRRIHRAAFSLLAARRYRAAIPLRLIGLNSTPATPPWPRLPGPSASPRTQSIASPPAWSWSAIPPWNI